MTRVTENDVALAIVKIASARPDGQCTFDRARSEVPNYVNLDPQDLAMSSTRQGEPMWHQLIRNIRSHHDVPGNFLHDGYLTHVSDVGYEVTAKGNKLLGKS